MTGAAEMRRVMAHAATALEKAGRDEAQRGARADTLLAIAYGRGVLDLLGTYLIDPEPQPAAPAAPGLTLHLLDNDGALWTSIDDGRWVYLDGSPMQESHSRDELATRWGPVREVWLR